MSARPAWKCILILSLVPVLVGFAGSGSASAARGDTLCVHFTGSQKGMHLHLHGDISINGTLPLTLCNLERGRVYDCITAGPGLEQRRGYLSIAAGGRPSVRGNRSGTSARNAAFPGWGSFYAGRGAAGWSDLLSLATTGYTVAREHDQYRRIEDRHGRLLEALEAAETVLERQLIREEAWSLSRDLNVQNRHRRRVLAFASYIYAFQLVDPWLLGNPPGAKVEAHGSVVHLEGAVTSRAKALALSICRPGRGQLYQGKRGRGIFFSLATTAAGLIALDRHNSYDGAVNDYEMNVRRFDAAETLREKEYYRDRAPQLWDEVLERRRDRNMAYGLLAAAWMANVIDAFFPGREDLPPLDVALDIGPTRALLVLWF